MSRFKEGDAVVITAIEVGDHWARPMHKFKGKEVIVNRSYDGEDRFRIYDNETNDTWWFYDKEAELVSDYMKDYEQGCPMESMFGEVGICE